MKDNKGITLIALVITIIVLLILAGITIAMLTGENGLLTKANDAAANQIIAESKDLASMAVAKAYADYVEDKYTSTPPKTDAWDKAVTVPAADTDKYSIANGTITITQKTADNKTVTGTIGADGSILWNAPQ